MTLNKFPKKVEESFEEIRELHKTLQEPTVGENLSSDNKFSKKVEESFEEIREFHKTLQEPTAGENLTSEAPVVENKSDHALSKKSQALKTPPFSFLDNLIALRSRILWSLNASEHAKEYYDSFELSGKRISVYRCYSTPPPGLYGGEMDIESQFVSNRASDKNSDEIYFEAYMSGENKAFFRSKSEPTHEELEFQLKTPKTSMPICKCPFLNTTQS